MNIQKLMQQAQAMQSKMSKAMAEFDEKEFDYNLAGGAIKIKVMGSLEITSIDIDNSLIDPSDKEMLEDSLKIAINEAVSKTNNQREEVSNSLTPKAPGAMF